MLVEEQKLLIFDFYELLKNKALYKIKSNLLGSLGGYFFIRMNLF